MVPKGQEDLNMVSIKDLKSKRQTTGKAKLAAGKYFAKVTNFSYDENFVDEGAFIITYELSQDLNGVKKPFSENFFNDLNNPRTADLAEFIEKLGLEYIEELLGQSFEVEIKYRLTNSGRSLPSIVDRKPLDIADSTSDKEVE